MTAGWSVRVSSAAQRDFSDIVAESGQRFGAAQADLYGSLLIDALAAPQAGPDLLGSKARDDVGPGLRTMTVSRRGRRGRHILLFRASGAAQVDVVRILHDRMDVARHAPPDPS